MTQQLVVDALRMAWFRRRPKPGLIVHSDRGSQYCSHLFQSTLKAYGMKSSMSRKADCWVNAPTESLWGSNTGRSHRGRYELVSVLQCEAIAFNAGVCESDAI
jgi:transposase InsO family protein